MTESAVELMVKFQRKHKSAGKDPLLKEIFAKFKDELLTCQCGRQLEKQCMYCRELYK